MAEEMVRCSLNGEGVGWRTENLFREHSSVGWMKWNLFSNLALCLLGYTERVREESIIDLVDEGGKE